jgi:hypothetical protein
MIEPADAGHEQCSSALRCHRCAISLQPNQYAPIAIAATCSIVTTFFYLIGVCLTDLLLARPVACRHIDTVVGVPSGRLAMKFFALTAVIGAMSAGVAQAESDVQMQDVPLVVQSAFSYAAQQQQATVGAIALDTDGGHATYEFRTTGADGTLREFDFFVDGSLDEIETIIQADAVPAHVMAAYKRYFPTGEMGKIEHSMRGNGSVWYETDTTVDGREIDVDISGDGTAILIADDAVN